MRRGSCKFSTVLELSLSNTEVDLEIKRKCDCGLYRINLIDLARFRLRGGSFVIHFEEIILVW